MKFFRSKRVYSGRALLGICIALVSVQPSQAGVACPVMLYGGKIDQGTVSVSFMNRGKAPIRELGLSCTPLQGQKATAVTGAVHDVNKERTGRQCPDAGGLCR
jgi:hypothetical protein